MWSLLAGIVIAPFYAFLNTLTFSSPDSTDAVSEEMEKKDAEVPAFEPSNIDGPPTRALKVSEIKKYASRKDEAVSA